MKSKYSLILLIILLTLIKFVKCEKKIKYRDPFPPEHEGYLPDNFKQRLREIAQNDYLTGEARIDLVDKVYDKLPKTVLMKLPLDPPIYQLPPPTQKKFRALMVDRSLGWRRRAQLYDQLVQSLPKNYRKLIDQFAKTGVGAKSSSSSSSSSESGGDIEGDPEMQAAGGGADMDQAGGGGMNGGMSGMMGGGGMSGMGSNRGGTGSNMGGTGSNMGGTGSMGGGGGGGGYSNGDGMGGTEMITDIDKSGIDYDKYISDSSSEEDSKDARGKPWAKNSQLNKKSRPG